MKYYAIILYYNICKKFTKEQKIRENMKNLEKNDKNDKNKK